MHHDNDNQKSVAESSRSAAANSMIRVTQRMQVLDRRTGKWVDDDSPPRIVAVHVQSPEDLRRR